MSHYLPCPKKSNACTGVDPPIENLSAEETDVVNQIFFPPIVDLPVTVPPAPLGDCPDGYIMVGGQCVKWTPPDTDTTFWNTDQTARVLCPDGSISVYTVLAGNAQGSTQELANANAMNLATAIAMSLCPPIPAPSPGRPGRPSMPDPPPHQTGFKNTTQTYTKTCPDGSSMSWTIYAGERTSMVSVDDANKLALKDAENWVKKRLICMTADSGPICFNQPASLKIGAKGDGFLFDNAGTATAHWDIDSLPLGMMIQQTNTQITGDYTEAYIVGTPNQGGWLPYLDFTIRVTAGTVTATKHVHRAFVGIQDIFVPVPTIDYNVPYSHTFTQSGMIAPVVWSLVGGSLPTGLTFDPATQILSGTPTEFGVFSFQLQVEGADGFKCTGWFSLNTDCVAEVVLEPDQGLFTEVASYNYSSVEDGEPGDLYGFTDIVLADAPPGHYFFIYVSGAFIQRRGTDVNPAPPYPPQYVSSAADDYQKDFITFGGGTASIPYTGSIPENYVSVAAVEANDANKHVEFDHLGGDISLTYAPWYTDVLGFFGPKDVEENSKWSLRIFSTGVKEIFIKNLPAGDYILKYFDGAGEFAGSGLWNTTGYDDKIVDDVGNIAASIPLKGDQASAIDAHDEATGDEIPFYWPGGDMFWELHYHPRGSEILSMPPWPTWKICATPP